MRESELASHMTFERFCKLRRIRAEPIQRTARPTPDYKVWIGAKCYIVELKQLDPNREDKRQRLELETTGQAAWWDQPVGQRAGNKVQKAKRQLGPSAERGLPTLLVLFDNTKNGLGVYIDPYDIKVAMCGNNAAHFSAVAVLFPEHPEHPQKAPYLVLYHNVLAAVPLAPECVAGITEYQYRWQDQRPNKIGCWVHAITGQCDDVFG